MKIKKRSLAAILAAAVLVCCVGVGFATSAAQNDNETDREENTVIPYPEAEEGFFTKEELDRLASLWFEGYEDLTVAEYQKKLWAEYDTPEDIKLIDDYGQYTLAADVWTYGESSEAADLFNNYFFYVYEPLTAGKWQERTFSDAAEAGTEDGGSLFLEYTYTLNILAPDTLTVGEYQQVPAAVKQCVQDMLDADLMEDDFAALSQRLSTDALTVTVEAGLPVRSYGPGDDTALHEQSSRESSDKWDRTLSPYAPFGLTWTFDDPDLDGNGLTMWFEGKEVRSITDTQEGMWITEHTGTSAYSDGAVDLYVVYTDGILSGLRFATPEEQAEWDEIRQNNVNATIPFGTLKLPTTGGEEQREFPRATLEDYNSLLTLRPVEVTDLPEWASFPYPDARDLPLEDFNQRLLDWANENPDTWDRIMCDVLWNDFDKELTSDAKTFAAVTCALSGTENGQMVRAQYTGKPEQDPHFSRQMPMKSNAEEGIVNAWCDLYYDISYHVSDKSAVTAWERDACVGGMMNAISAFWQDTDFDTLLGMSEADVVAEFNRLAAEASTEGVKINPITEDNIHFGPYDERGIRY